jgi:hypothetical protein
VAHHGEAAERADLGLLVAVFLSHRPHQGEQSVRLGEIAGAEGGRGQLLLRRPAQRCPQ